MINRIMFASR